MKKIAFLSIVLFLMGSLMGCNKANDPPNETIDVDLGDIEKNVETEPTDSTEPETEIDATDETVEEDSKNEDNESSGSDKDGETNDAETDDGTDTETGETTSTEDPDGSSEDENVDGSTGDGTEGDTSSTSTETDTENQGEEPEPEVIDYTAKITHPYEDLDYTPQEKTSGFESNPAINVKGVFITANTAASSRVNDFVTLLNETELNALVIDVKNDDGTILFHSAAAEKYVPGANSGAQIKDMEAFMKLMKDNDIYTIARIVTFKSPMYAEMYPERAISYINSEKVYYADSAHWASPFDEHLWEYNVAIAKEAIAFGFNEIQFDYVRFPATGSKLDKSLDFKNPNGNSKSFAVQEFVKYARKEINAMDAYVALDVFGWTATTTNDSGIGQHWEAMSNVTDYMCPMVYPSHYGVGNFGLKVPDANPYTTIYESMSDAQERNANIETPAKLRPWLQAFTATWVKGYIPYRKAEIQAQIKACADLGIEDYIFWNASNNYTKGWFDEE